MPLAPASVSAIMLPQLVAVSLVGVGTPDLARALGVGVCTWTPKIQVQTVDSGTAGGGKGVPVPIILAQPVVYANLLSGFRAQGILGLVAPLFILGLTTGFIQSYATALTNTSHIGVGLGAGVATFKPPPAFQDFKRAFDSVGATGDGATKLCKAISQGLESTFGILVLAQPIVGPPTPSPGVGTGVGSIF